MSMFILAILLVQAVTIAPVRASAQEDFPELDYWLLSVTGPYPGAMQTGAPPFLAQTDPIPGPTGTTSFVPNEPLQTAMAIPNNPDDINIFEYMGNLSPYFVPPGFGVDEYSLPSVCEITQVNVLSRHGSRYPDAASSMMDFATGWQNISTWTGDLAFLNNWTYALGVEDLVPKGRQELFDHGILEYYNYGRLYNTSSTIVARTTSQYRMLETAWYFLSGFFGLSWAQNATLEYIPEEVGFNNTLASAAGCPRYSSGLSLQGNSTSSPVVDAIEEWQYTYLANATSRLNPLVTGYNWTYLDSFNAQAMCTYEIIAFGYSSFCSLFTADEWIGFGYAQDLLYVGTVGFQSPIGRALGVGWVNELHDRLLQVQPNGTFASENSTLDDSPSTFPLNQTLYFDFSHDYTIIAVIAAMGLSQFTQFLPSTGPPPNQQNSLSNLVPYGARMVFEKIECSAPISSDRSGNLTNGTEPTTYVHMLLNQRTVPLGFSYQACGNRSDGWCELNAFVHTLEEQQALVDFDYSCYGNYTLPPWGNVTNGLPPQAGS